MRRGQGPGSRDKVSAALQTYADRGVFRGFRATPLARGRVEYQFLWLTKKPMTAVFDPLRRRLTFPSVLPHVDRHIAADMKAIVDARRSRSVPAHKRIDARKCRLAATVRNGDLSLTADIRGANHDYAVSRALNVINEMFVALHEHHPAYLIERFGISTE